MSTASSDPLALEAFAMADERHRPRSHWRWLIRRLMLGLVVLWLASVLIFAATHALPSDPARAILGRDATAARVIALRHELGLDRPLLTQYLSWLGGAIHGDFGTSLAARESVTQLIGNRVINSLTLLALVGIISIPTAIGLGVLTAVRRDRLFDRGILLGSLGLTALPDFVIGMLLIIILATSLLHVFPAVALIPPGDSPLAHLSDIALPLLTLVLSVVPYLYRLVRATVVEVLESEYVAMARLKGLSERVVLIRHVLPNALVPVLQGSAFVLTYLLGSSVVIEALYGFPGLGGALADAINTRDVPVMQAIVLVIAAAVVVANLIADALTVFLTPKLRTAGWDS